MAVCSSTFCRITPTLVASSSLLVTREENAASTFGRVRRFIGVCFYARVCAGRCYARNVFNFSEPRNHIARMHVQPCAPSGGRYRGEYSGYNGCCEHLRFSACETSSLSTLKGPRDERINGDNRWTGYFVTETLSRINASVYLILGAFSHIMEHSVASCVIITSYGPDKRTDDNWPRDFCRTFRGIAARPSLGRSRTNGSVTDIISLSDARRSRCMRGHESTSVPIPRTICGVINARVRTGKGEDVRCGIRYRLIGDASAHMIAWQRKLNRSRRASSRIRTGSDKFERGIDKLGRRAWRNILRNGRFDYNSKILYPRVSLCQRRVTSRALLQIKPYRYDRALVSIALSAAFYSTYCKNENFA